MTVKRGKLQSVSSGGGFFERTTYTIYEKDYGSYRECVYGRYLYENGSVIDGVETVETSYYSDENYNVYPEMDYTTLVSEKLSGYSWVEQMTTIQQ